MQVSKDEVNLVNGSIKKRDKDNKDPKAVKVKHDWCLCSCSMSECADNASRRAKGPALKGERSGHLMSIVNNIHKLAECQDEN